MYVRVDRHLSVKNRKKGDRKRDRENERKSGNKVLDDSLENHLIWE